MHRHWNPKHIFTCLDGSWRDIYVDKVGPSVIAYSICYWSQNSTLGRAQLWKGSCRTSPAQFTRTPFLWSRRIACNLTPLNWCIAFGKRQLCPNGTFSFLFPSVLKDKYTFHPAPNMLIAPWGDSQTIRNFVSTIYGSNFENFEY